jgi:hypothetical protein
MTIHEFLDQIDVLLSKAQDGPPEGLRPAGTFVGTPPGTISGLIVVAPDGSRFYLGAWVETDEPDDDAADPGGGANGKEG